MEETISILKQTGIATLCGGIGGIAIATFRLKPKKVYGFLMASNWFLVSLPFFTTRSLIIQYRESMNKELNIPLYVNRDRDHFLASSLSGGIIGIGLGYIYRGKSAVIPGCIVYSMIAAIGQSVYTWMRHARQEYSYNLIHNPSPPSQPYKLQIRKTDHTKVAMPEDWDPARDLFDKFTRFLVRSLFISEDSPYARAFDMKYRESLECKVIVLKDEIEGLRRQLTSSSSS